MNKKRFRAVFLSIIILITLIIIVLWTKTSSAIKKPIISNEEKIEVVVNDGEGFYKLVERLDNEGLVQSPFFIKLGVKIKGLEIKVIPGTYTIDSSIDLKGFIETLAKEDHSKNAIKVTIPEGYNIEQMGEKFQEAGLFTKDEWLNAVKNFKTPSYIKAPQGTRYALEGYLYANTYLFNKDAKPEDVINIMLKEFEKTLEDIEKETGITIKEEDITKIITIASLIEKESKSDEDRPLIASVIYNRLEDEMKLQIDATVLYAHGKHINPLLNEHLIIESPYNTYYVNGLPIGPIGSPRKESIKAAIMPAKTDYIYYLLSKDKKSHYFTNDYNDFLNKKAEYQKYWR